MAMVVFDLDGTLVDSAPDIRAAVNRMLAEEGAAPLDLATTISFIGNGLPKLTERAIAARGLDMARHDALTGRVLDYYDQDSATLTRLYPGVRECLEELHFQGVALGLCTNKPQRPAAGILSEFGIARLFSTVIGGDSLAVKKPDPAPLRAAFGAAAPGPRIYVGDSEVDAETAVRAGVPFVLFTEGYRKRPVADLPHAAAYSEFAALPALLARMLAAGA